MINKKLSAASMCAVLIISVNISVLFASDEETGKVSATVSRSFPASAMSIDCGPSSVVRISGTNVRNTDLMGFGISYRDFSLSYSQTLFDGPKIYDTTGDLFFGRLGFEIMLQKYKGFHWAGEGESGWTDEYGNYANADPDLSITNYRLHCFYFFFDDYSYSNAYVNKTGSRSFCWSPFLRISPGYFGIKNTQPIIPPGQYPNYDTGLHDMTRVDCVTCAFSAGLTAIFPVWKFYFSPIATIGYEPQYYSHNGADGRQRGVGTNFVYDFRLLLAFSGETLTAGAWMCNDNQFADFNRAQFMVSNVQIDFFAGIRF